MAVAVKKDWAPDGRRLVFTGNADDFPRPGNIATVRPDVTGLRYLTDLRSPKARASVGGYSPDGNWIVVPPRGPRPLGSVYRMRPNGGAVQAILGLSRFRPRFIEWGTRQSRVRPLLLGIREGEARSTLDCARIPKINRS